VTGKEDPIDFDTSDPSLGADLFGSLNALREKRPVAWSTAHNGFWVLTKYEDVAKASVDSDSFTTSKGIMIPPNVKSVPALPAEADPPRHTQMRRALMPFFNSEFVNALIPQINTIVSDAVADIAPLGQADLVSALGLKIPPLVLAAMLGLPPDEAENIHTLTSDLLGAVGRDMEAAMAAAQALEGWVHDQVDQRLGVTPHDTLGEIVNASLDPQNPLSRNEIAGLVHLMIIAGHETTTNGISAMLYRYMTVEGLRERVQADPGLIEAVVEESLRLDPPIYNFARTARRDTQLGDTEICSGEWVMLLYGAANRDPDRFPDPDSFIVPRASNQHLSFGWGRHRCLGAPLARYELRAVMAEVLATIPDIEITGEPTSKCGSVTQGFATLPVTFTSRP
jgi:cytochrome P450